MLLQLYLKITLKCIECKQIATKGNYIIKLFFKKRKKIVHLEIYKDNRHGDISGFSLTSNDDDDGYDDGEGDADADDDEDGDGGDDDCMSDCTGGIAC